MSLVHKYINGELYKRVSDIFLGGYSIFNSFNVEWILKMSCLFFLLFYERRKNKDITKLVVSPFLP